MTCRVCETRRGPVPRGIATCSETRGVTARTISKMRTQAAEGHTGYFRRDKYRPAEHGLGKTSRRLIRPAPRRAALTTAPPIAVTRRSWGEDARAPGDGLGENDARGENAHFSPIPDSQVDMLDYVAHVLSLVPVRSRARCACFANDGSDAGGWTAHHVPDRVHASGATKEGRTTSELCMRRSLVTLQCMNTSSFPTMCLILNYDARDFTNILGSSSA